jgi:hypothetical protein
MIRRRFILGLLLLGSLLLEAGAVAQSCTKYCDVNYEQCQGAEANEYSNSLDVTYSGGPYPRIPCESASINAHGKYTSLLAPCMFTFHTALNDNVTVSGDGLALSTLCSDNNRVGHVAEDYVFNWGDECVRDFARCYSLEQDVDIYMPFVCSKKWTLPVGATHISVSCTRDNEMVNEQINISQEASSSLYHSDDNAAKEMREEDRKEMHELEIFAIAFSVVVFVLCLCCCFVGHRWFVAPYHSSAARPGHSESIGLVIPATTTASHKEVV